MNLYNDLQDNINYVKKTVKAQDIIFYNFEVDNKKMCVCYVDSLTNKNQLGQLLIQPILKNSLINVDDILTQVCIANIKSEQTFEKAINQLIDGLSLLFVDGENKVVLADLISFESRSIAEPPTAMVVKGPREGFTECLKTNISLIRRRIKSKDLRIDIKQVGKYTKTNIAICYVSSIADENLVNDIIDRLKLINIDGIPDSSYISKMIIEHKTSLFKQVGNSEKPDIISEKMLEGRVAIIVDGSPIAITVPYLLIEDFQSSEDYFVNNYRANMERAIRVISVIVAIYLPALFVGAQLFHLQIIPLNFLLTIVNSIKGIPLSPSYEMFVTLLIFEILNEASIRMPKYVGMALSVVGALVLGDTAVKAGIVSTPTILIMALSGICLYTVPELVDTMSVLRLAFLITAGSFGCYGMLLLSVFLLAYLSSLENFGVPFLAPVSPLVKKDLKDSLYIDFISNMKLRPKSFKNKNKVRSNIKDVR